MRTDIKTMVNLLIAVIIVPLIMMGCGGSGVSSTAPSSGMINAAAGGTLTSSDGNLTLTIPPGALSENTMITIKTVGGAGALEYELLPDGLTFSTPATVSLTMDVADEDGLLDENGAALDLSRSVPSAMFFLESDTRDGELIDNVAVSNEEGSSVITATIPILHFTSMVGAAGNSYYVYMTSLGTHYVGSDFKADVNIRYLGYNTKSTYQNMSIEYTVNSITVNKITFDVSGAIDIVTPSELTRSAFLSQRGQEDATRPKFNCNEVGDGTVTVTVDVTAIVEVIFQPENVTRLFTINQSESTARRGKCIARIGLNDRFSTGSGEGEFVSADDPTDDLELEEGGFVASAAGMGLPGYVDITQGALGIVNGEALEANVVLASNVVDPTASNVPLLGFIVGPLAASPGGTGFPWLDDLGSFMGVEAQAADTALASGFYRLTDGQFVMDENVDVDMYIDGNVVGMLMQLDDLGLTSTEAMGESFRLVTEYRDSVNYPGATFFDELDLAL